jgi:bifunctional non-homologous end joining protein LigD
MEVTGAVTMIVSLARADRQACWPMPLAPMLPSPAPPFHRPGWIYEEKYDGWRCLAYKRDGLVRLLSRNGIDYTGRFRALAAAIALLPASTLLLDGEVTAFDEHLLSRRAFLHPDPDALVTPPIYIAFDCIHASGRDLRDHPLGARREVLEDLIDDQHLLFPARRLPAHGLAAWAEVQRRGYEGLVAKDESSAYRSGRTRAWLKVKLAMRKRGPAEYDRAGTSDRGRPESTPLPVPRPLLPPSTQRLLAFDSGVFH